MPKCSLSAFTHTRVFKFTRVSGNTRCNWVKFYSGKINPGSWERRLYIPPLNPTPSGGGNSPPPLLDDVV